MSPPDHGTLEAGAQVGPYEVVGLLGVGGMGEVYRARDPRLGREVAIKVLPRSREGPEQAQRLEREARAAGALNHPNIVAVYDVGTRGENPYVVTELLEGETLRERLRHGRLATRRAIEYGIQIAEGLAAAHDRGIWHRDIKPENLFLTRDGHVKILDFGLAKRSDPDAIDNTATGPVREDAVSPTSSGVVIGTVGYMSPEQVRGGIADHRSDIFSFGAVLYEMVSGERAFRRPTPPETMTAILHDHPPDLAPVDGALSVGLSHLIHRCLEKDPHHRFQSALDLAFHLKELQGVWDTTAPRKLLSLPRRVGRNAALGLVVLATALAAFVVGRTGAPPVVPEYRQVSFRRGLIHRARFGPDGQTILYSASWAAGPAEVRQTLVGSPESRRMSEPGTIVTAVSRSGELALLKGFRYQGGERYLGTLARSSWAGGAAREIQEDILEADWGPDGSLAVLRAPTRAGGETTLEYPIGTILLQTNDAIHDLRVSPDGTRVAFFQDPGSGFGGAVTVVERSRQQTTLTTLWANARGLAWSRSGREIWFTAGEEGHRSLRAVPIGGGKPRVLDTAPASLTLRDVSPAGRAIVSRDIERRAVVAQPPGGDRERELSWLDRSAMGDLSSDGKMVLFGDRFRVYVRDTDGSDAVQVGEGNADAISHDKRWVLVTSRAGDRLSIVPVGAGEARVIAPGPITQYAGAHWFPDDQRLLLNAREAGQSLRLYVQSVDGGPPRPIAPEGSTGQAVSPVGSLVAFLGPDRRIWILPTEGTAPPLVVGGTEAGERPIAWTADGRSLWIWRREEIPAHVFLVDVLTGHREPWRTFMPEDPAGLVAIPKIDIAADGQSYAYSYRRILSELYVVDGLR